MKNKTDEKNKEVEVILSESAKMGIAQLDNQINDLEKRLAELPAILDNLKKKRDEMAAGK